MSTATALAFFFESRGYDVATAETVAAGLCLLSWRPDCVILDLNLPDGNGVSILREIRAAGMTSRVAITTGTADPDELADAARCRPDALLMKPVDLAELTQVLGAG